MRRIQNFYRHHYLGLSGLAATTMQNEKRPFDLSEVYRPKKVQAKTTIPLTLKISIKITPYAKSLCSFSGLNLLVDLFSKFEVA